MAISKLKAALRKLAERTVAGLIAVFEGCAGLFKRDECENYFETCGHEPAELPLLATQPERISASRTPIIALRGPTPGCGIAFAPHSRSNATVSPCS